MASRRGVARAVWVGTSYLLTYLTYVPEPAQKRLPGRIREPVCTRLELPRSVPDFFAGSNLTKKAPKRLYELETVVLQSPVQLIRGKI